MLGHYFCDLSMTYHPSLVENITRLGTWTVRIVCKTQNSHFAVPTPGVV